MAEAGPGRGPLRQYWLDRHPWRLMVNLMRMGLDGMSRHGMLAEVLLVLELVLVLRNTELLLRMGRHVVILRWKAVVGALPHHPEPSARRAI